MNHTIHVGCFIHMPLLVISFLLLGFNVIVFATNDLPSLHDPKPLCHDHEKSALLRFKHSFLLDCNRSTSPLAYPKVKSWHETDCCRWDGVECDDKIGHVIGLDLSSSCLYGTFPPNSTLFSLDNLLKLNLAYNDFNYSEIPSEISHLYKLTHLNLSESVFSGIIPSNISRLSKLSLLDLSGNRDPNAVESQSYLKFHDMSLEKLVSNFTRLTHLILDYVDISSTVPDILINHTSLKVMSLENCRLFGDFPVELFLLPNLEKLSLYFNPGIGGYLPHFQSHSLLRYLDLGGTMFSGELPSSLGNLRSLNFLRLKESEFSGQIPLSIGNLTELTTLSLSNNYLSGNVPISITNLTKLTILELSDVIITELEIVNSWLSKLNKLTTLLLKNMNLGNGILHPLRNLTSLNYLDLSNNQITGQLPQWLMNLTQIAYLNMLSNHLEGPVPSWVSHLTSLQWLVLSFNNSVGMFDSFLKLPNLKVLHLVGVTPTFPSNISTNTSLLQLNVLALESCNLREFPEFLRSQNHLQGLLLSGSKIRGKIPQWLVNITSESLLELDISNNHVTGFEEPPQVFLPWKKMVVLNINANRFRGPLLSPPKSIQNYKASNNMFTGDIPSNICDGTSLIYLDLSSNNLSGQIPRCVVHQLAGTLQVLNLRGNKFGGTIPQTFSPSCKLKMINLSENQLEGKLPTSMGNCSMLEVLDVGRNLISDSFPQWLGNLPKLQVLVLRHNNFHGRIIAPFHGHHFQSLHIIDVSYNLFKGNLPSRYIQNWLAMAVSNEDMSASSKSLFRLIYVSGDFILIDDESYNYGITISNKGVETFYQRILTVFRVIDFSSNKFTGRIPEIIGNLKGLQALNLSNNDLVGGIPPSLANVTDLEALDLSQNMLSGEIPQDLTVLTSLEIFNVSHNQLVGRIPQGKQFNTFDASSFEGNSALCGAQFSMKCEKTDSLPPSSQQELTTKSNETIGWIIRSLGCASGLVVGYIIGKIYVTDRHHDWFVETFERRGRSKTKVMKSTPRLRVRN